MNSSYTSSVTIIRLEALHAWPPFSIRAAAAALATLGRSAPSSTMNGSEPPSSSTTFFRFWPAVAATAEPARSLPVTDTPAIRGSAIISATCSLLANTLMYASEGSPASRKICSMARADSGHCGACLSTIVLPIIRLGAANRATW